MTMLSDVLLYLGKARVYASKNGLKFTLPSLSFSDLLWYPSTYLTTKGVSLAFHATMPGVAFSVDLAYYVYLGISFYLARQVERQSKISKIGWL